MATKLSTIETLARQRLVEPTPRFWSSAELIDIITAGVKDLWRDIVDLKQEHFLTINTDDVSFPAGSDRLVGVPDDVHKVYLIEAKFLQTNSPNVGLQFRPKDYNHNDTQLARSRGAIDAANDTIYYSITSSGSPSGSTIIYCAPEVNRTIPIRFCYAPTIGVLGPDDNVPIPGEADNALVAWCVSYARAKETDDHTPDETWLAIYATEKAHLLESLGLRQYQEPTYVDALFQEYWALFLATGLSMFTLFA
jgi:hypothetical protein